METRVLQLSAEDLKSELGQLVYELVSAAWPDNTVVIWTRDIPLANLDPLKKALRRHADAESIDLDVIVFCSMDGDQAVEETRWGLGWDDGDQIFVYLYPMEFFDSEPGAEEKFQRILLPDVLA